MSRRSDTPHSADRSSDVTSSRIAPEVRLVRYGRMTGAFDLLGWRERLAWMLRMAADRVGTGGASFALSVDMRHPQFHCLTESDLSDAVGQAVIAMGNYLGDLSVERNVGGYWCQCRGCQQRRAWEQLFTEALRFKPPQP